MVERGAFHNPHLATEYFGNELSLATAEDRGQDRWLCTRTALEEVRKEEGRWLFYGFLQTKEGVELIQKSRQIMADLDRYQEEEFSSRFSGRIFECIAAMYLEKQLPSHETLITPSHTFSIFKDTYSQRRVLSGRFGLNLGIARTKVPDGIVLREARNTSWVSALCEYSLLGEQSEKWEGLYFSFEDSNARQRQFKENVANCVRRHYSDLPRRVMFDSLPLGFVYVMPDVDEESGEFHFLDLNLLTAEVYFVPITRLEFGRVIQGIIQDNRDLVSSPAFALVSE